MKKSKFSLKINLFFSVCRKRQAEDAESFGALYDSALELDTDDCAKLMVCHVFEKPVDQLNAFETKINQVSML